jgi:hypothetical protein
MDYNGDPYLDFDTPGLISNNVSRRKVSFICLLIRLCDSSDYVSTYGGPSPSEMSIDGFL